MAHRDGGQAAAHTVAIGGTADIKGLAAMMASVENDPKQSRKGVSGCRQRLCNLASTINKQFRNWTDRSVL
jgi:hypothetical protein